LAFKELVDAEGKLFEVPGFGSKESHGENEPFQPALRKPLEITRGSHHAKQSFADGSSGFISGAGAENRCHEDMEGVVGLRLHEVHDGSSVRLVVLFEGAVEL